MSGYPGGPPEGSNGLDSLFAQLRQQQPNKPVNLESSYNYYPNNGNNYFGQPSQSQQAHQYQQPSVASAMPTPPVPGPQPHHGSAIMIPIETPALRVVSNAERERNSSSLLNLLKFSQPSAASSNQPAIGTPSREPSGSYSVAEHGHPTGSNRGGIDLLASLMGGVQPRASPLGNSSSYSSNSQPAFGSPAPAPSADTQAYLLQLLNQPKPSQSDEITSPKPTKVMTSPSKASTPGEIGDLADALGEVDLQSSMMGVATEDLPLSNSKENMRNPPAKGGLFTYVNPFDQLAASSPRNLTPKILNAGSPVSVPTKMILKHPRHDSPDTSASMSSPARTRVKLGEAVPNPSALSSPVNRRNSVASSKENKETVHDALSEVGDTVNQQVQEAIARAEAEDPVSTLEEDLRHMLELKSEKDFLAEAQTLAKTIQGELQKDKNAGALDDLPEHVAEAVKDIIDDAAQGHIADSWESADAEDSLTKEEDANVVKVYTFPMRPWTSITIKESAEEARPTFRDEAVMDIARLKKEFDQIDRTLVTASNNFIVYGMSKNGGFRIIRQDDGKDTRLFTETHDRVFTVVTSVAAADQKESIIGTGISGTVYWAMIKDGEGDRIEESNPEMYGFALPPIQTSENESPGGVLKTRARKSSGHPDFFAVGRGKFINIIWPSVIMKQSYLKHGLERLVDTERYLSNHSLRINTGKAGKDFAFSEDDTTIVSLDKAGRVKFWDIRELTKPELWATQSQKIELKDPLNTLTTTPASEKSWPTSVLLVDKLRPYQRGGALRYLIVGMKQNHTLQLWDLALQKPVQEIHLPHNKESDAVCSVLYHAATSIIVVGHPTRNSVYFLSLSAPKYNLPKSVTQADFMAKIVSKDPSIPKPESTAVISGMREYSFANKGMLRSIDILQTPNSTAASGEPQTQFELYAMHSKGVTCLNIKQADLGWNSQNKVICEVDGEESGTITIETLKELPPPTPEITEPVPTTSTPLPTRIISRPAPVSKESNSNLSPKKANGNDSSAPKEERLEKEKKETPSTSAPGMGKKNRRKATSAESSGQPPAFQATKNAVLEPTSNSRNGNLSKFNVNTSAESSGSIASQEMSDAALKNIETRVSAEVKKLIETSLDSLLANIKDDRRTQTAVADAKSDAMLRLVSSTLSDNIEVTLGRIVNGSIEKDVLPTLSTAAMKAVNEQLGGKLTSHLVQNIPKELQKALPDAIARALQQPQLLKLMSDSLAKSVAFRVEEQFGTLLQSVVAPAFTNLAIQSSKKAATDIQREASSMVAAIQAQRQEDSIKIEQLTQLVTGLSQTVSSMAAAQTEFQAQFLRMQQQAASDRREAAIREKEQSSRASESRPSTALTAPAEKSAADLEYETMLESIIKAMNQGNYENAIIQWLQTRREQEVFTKYFADRDSSFLIDCSPLLLLSLGATLSLVLDDEFLTQRVVWLNAVLDAFQLHITADDLDPQVRDLIPKIMGIYIQRLEHILMRASGQNANNPILKPLQDLRHKANYILLGQHAYHQHKSSMSGNVHRGF